MMKRWAILTIQLSFLMLGALALLGLLVVAYTVALGVAGLAGAVVFAVVLIAAAVSAVLTSLEPTSG